MKAIRVTNRTRAQDERDLEMLRLRRRGKTFVEIGAVLHMKPNAVSFLCEKIREDDMAVHDPTVTAKAYERAYR